MSVRDWLDAGYVMLVENADPDLRGLLDDLFEADTPDEMEERFGLLREELDLRTAERQAAEAEAARRGGRKRRRRARRVPEGAIDAAVAEWDALVAETPTGPSD